MNGTTIPTGRDNTYSPAETDIDIQTGRAVYVDSDRYESDEAYKARVDKYVAEGFHMIKDGESSDGGSDGGDSSGGGTASDLLIVEVDGEGLSNHTWQEIYDAYPNVCIVQDFLDDPDVPELNKLPIVRVWHSVNENEYKFMVGTYNEAAELVVDIFSTTEPNGYPMYTS